jgi:hypothetical protein
MSEFNILLKECDIMYKVKSGEIRILNEEIDLFEREFFKCKKEDKKEEIRIKLLKRYEERDILKKYIIGV